MNKFNRILIKCNPSYNSLFNNDNSKWLVNVSNKQILDFVLKFLSLGDRFGLPLNCDNKNDRVDSVLHVIKNFELNCRMISTESAKETRLVISNSLRMFLTNKRHVHYIDRYVSKEFEKCSF